MGNTTDIQLYETLLQKLGNAEAEALVCFVDAKIKSMEEHNLKMLATKEDLKDVESMLKEDLRDMEIKLVREIEESKTATIRWVAAIFITLMLGIIGLYVKK